VRLLIAVLAIVVCLLAAGVAVAWFATSGGYPDVMPPFDPSPTVRPTARPIPVP
jgi:hypothetical protein